MSQQQGTDYYKVLGVDKKASQDQIKSAFRKLSLKNHPDKGGDQKKFQNINEAYQTLGDSQKRRDYDNRGRNPFASMRSNMPRGFSNMGMPPEMAEMFFGAMGGNMRPGSSFSFSSSGNPNRQQSQFGGHPNVRIFRNGVPVNNQTMQKAKPIIKTIHISLEEAYNGMKYPLEVERWILEGNTRRIEKEKIYVDISQGIDDNEMIILRGKGNIINDNNKGDIKIFIKIENKTSFKRQGLQLVLEKEISLHEALFGFEFEICYLNDRRFTIKNYDNVIQPGYKKVVPNLGMTRDNKTGELIIEFTVKFPKKIDQSIYPELKEQAKQIFIEE